jgi:hypothetical protein
MTESRRAKAMAFPQWLVPLIPKPVMCLSAVMMALGIACSDSPSSSRSTVDQSPPFFEDITNTSGVQARYRNGEEAGKYTILEAMGGGIALLDFDGDGLLDIVVAGGGYFEGVEIRGHPCRIFKNLGGCKFADVTESVGLDRPVFYSHGCAVADYDCDGWPDLLVTGYGRIALFHNVSDGRGGRRFADVAQEAGLNDGMWSTSAAWADLDGDGFPDLYVCHYVDWSFKTKDPVCIGFDGKRRDICPPGHFAALPHRLYRNNGNGSFSDISKAAGLRVEHPRADFGKGLGVIAVDINDDAKPDIYVANDMTDNFLYLNISNKEVKVPGAIRLREVGLDSGVARDHLGSPNGSMGVAAADYDGSGRPSLWVTNYEGELHALYHNDSRAGRTLFHFATSSSGIAVLGQTYVGWGTSFLDLDHDGLEHIFFVSGHPNHFPRAGARRAQRPVLLRNLGRGRFRPIMDQGGSYFQQDHNGRGVAFGDLDNDGRTDIVVSHLNEPVTVLRNTAASSNHWLGIELVGQGHRDIVGARLTLEIDGRRICRFAHGGGSYLSSSDRRHIFGLGSTDRAGRLTVRWPSGREEHWDNLAVDRYWRLTEGSGPPSR